LSETKLLYQEESWLRKQYWDNELGFRKLADLAGCGTSTIRYWFRKFGIPSRDMSEAIRLSKSKGDELYRNVEWLRTQYIDNGFSMQMIADISGCTAATILHWLRKFDIPRRGGSEAIKLSHDKGRHNRVVDDELKHKLSEGVKAAYARGDYDKEEYRQRRSETMKRLWAEGVFDHVGPMRSEWIKSAWASGKLNGNMENNSNWRGGLSFEPYTPKFNEEFKQSIRERDNYTCGICWLPGKSVHHINYVKKDTNLENCIILCKSCHGVTNHNRDYWQPRLSALMEARANR